MGKVKGEIHIYIGGVETPDRTNELIVIRDVHDEDGHGVYITDGYSGNDSFTTCFGYGPMAELMADKLFDAIGNYYAHRFKNINNL
ncbi:hypothetical protein AAAC51_06555 [Priestia megaterium]